MHTAKILGKADRLRTGQVFFEALQRISLFITILFIVLSCVSLHRRVHRCLVKSWPRGTIGQKVAKRPAGDLSKGLCGLNDLCIHVL